ncbi:MAG: alkaline phosphatase [Muribaculaceae bacterium]|nr:alkaline phosphatase [Muribaculaceae bacterium]
MKHRFISMIAASFISTASFLSFADAPKYIFYFIGDGMGMAPAMAAATYNRSVLGTAELPLMMTFPVAGQVMTYSASSDVTDSAAAGTALATGNKTVNGMLGVTPDTTAVYSIAGILKDKLGYGVGLVTNVAADDATPGAFYAHVPHRKMAKEIDRQFAEGNVDFLAGASLNGLYDKDGNSTGVPELFEKNNIRLVNTIDEIGNGTERIALIEKNPFHKSNIGYVNDSIPGKLTLTDMTQACLDYLIRKTPDGFFMMVEGGNIDHALHGNDGLSAISEIYNFNDALTVAYRFLLAHPEETLIVVTADHDTGGLSIGNNANGYVAHFDVLKSQKMSKEMFSDVCKKWLGSNRKQSWTNMKAFLKENFGFWGKVKIDDKETEALKTLYADVFEKKNSKEEKSLYNNFNAFASEVFRLISKKAAVGFTTGAHTGNPVPVYSAGVGSENFGRLLNNTEIPAEILRISGLSF